jgi:hypothetical protein
MEAVTYTMVRQRVQARARTSQIALLRSLVGVGFIIDKLGTIKLEGARWVGRIDSARRSIHRAVLARHHPCSIELRECVYVEAEGHDDEKSGEGLGEHDL